MRRAVQALRWVALWPSAVYWAVRRRLWDSGTLRANLRFEAPFFCLTCGRAQLGYDFCNPWVPSRRLCCSRDCANAARVAAGLEPYQD